ncbi:hypothetical protein NM688_g8832 [Phlebia brevispora]|uniref:Uncharacterized protein n=1 Tax=Phlebia brevispora TaxID=194682 RepID=A0ACC1RN44_9APHY|nr:hypothetical protein NM688_g8832 [Phlebia brevispora]
MKRWSSSILNSPPVFHAIGLKPRDRAYICVRCAYRIPMPAHLTTMEYPLLKAALLVLSAYCTFISTNSPNPPATPEEQARYVKDNKIRDPLAMSFRRWNTNLFRSICYCTALAEALFIVLSTIGALPRAPQLFHPSSALDLQDLSLSNFFIYGVCSMSLAAYIRSTCFRHLGRLYTFELSVKKDHRLITDGPYAIVRHPGYVGSVLFYTGACCAQLGPGSLLAASGLWRSPVGAVFAITYLSYCAYVCSFLLARVSKEDKVLKQQFRAEWEEWAKRTPYRLIPYVY